MAVLIALITIAVKDYLIPVLTENRAVNKIKRNAFKKYAHPIIISSISLLYRLDEILSHRAQYLLMESAQNEFNKYKFISTVYRVCALMGWLRASNIELSHIEVNNTEEYQKLISAITGFEKAMADGQHLEERVLAALCKTGSINISTLNNQQKAAFGSRLENVIQSFCDKNRSISVIHLNAEYHQQLVKTVIEYLCKNMSVPNKNDDFFTAETVKACIQNMGWKEGLIYRDWQSAIGDLMIKPNAGLDRKYDVIGFKEFEELFYSENAESKKWITRALRLFEDLNIEQPPPSEARPEQLNRIFVATYCLLETNSNLTATKVKIAKETLAKFAERNKSLKQNMAQTPK